MRKSQFFAKATIALFLSALGSAASFASAYDNGRVVIPATMEVVKTPGKELIMYRDVYGYKYFNTHKSANPNKFLVNTIPKSGTYLLQTMLSNLSIPFAGVHLAEWGFQDLRAVTQREFYADPLKHTHVLPLATSTSHITTGQFAVGHVYYSEENAKILESFKMVFVHRNIRDCLVSYMNFIQKNNLSPNISLWKDIQDPKVKFSTFMNTDAKAFFDISLPTTSWVNHKTPNIMCVSYEDLMADQADPKLEGALVRIATFVDVSLERMKASHAKAITSPSMTRSDERADWRKYFSPEAELTFNTLGGFALNKRLGYEEIN